MKCAACGYEYASGVKEWDKPDGHGGSHRVGGLVFEEIEGCFRVTAKPYEGAAKIGLYVCPVCGTIRAQ
jgi:hypothetical protein